MPEAIPDSIKGLLRDRRALLWVCQRHDLVPGEDPHDYDLPEGSAALRYRGAPDDSDEALGSLFWESIWLEGAKSPLLSVLRAVSTNQPSSSRRPLVVLASESDANAQISSQEFLPVYVLPGLLDPQASPDARYGVMRGKQRERRAAWPLAEQLASFPGRLLVLAGATAAQDLERIYDVLDDILVLDLQLLLIWPDDAPSPPPPPNPGVVMHVWRHSVDEFVSAAQLAGAPHAMQLSRWSIRVGNHTLELQARDLHSIEKQFVILTERDLIAPESFSIEDLSDFLNGVPNRWAGFGAGLPVPRDYVSDANQSLIEEVEQGFRQLMSDGNSQLTYLIRLPCEGGSGATTMLRQAAFAAAARGYPALILRPERLLLDTEQLLAFLTSLTEAAVLARVPDNHPLLIVLDVQHGRSTGARQLPQLLAAHGKRAVILQATQVDERNNVVHRGSRRVQLTPLLSEATKHEIQGCEAAIRSLVSRWALPVDVPTLKQWEAYESATRTRTPSGVSGASSLFWVGLRYFLTDGMDAISSAKARTALGGWVAKRINSITDDNMRQVITYVAALSAARIASPLWTVLRPITGGEFRSELTQVLKQCGDIVTWDDYSEEVQDYLIRFLHPALAEEFLSELGFEAGMESFVHVLNPVLAMLSTGQLGDIWVADEIATAIVPQHGSRWGADWEWRLQVFERLPIALRESDKTVLHHWARCLYFSADPSEVNPVDDTVRKRRLELATDRLQRAVQLPRRPGQDEYPSHLYNTLGTAYSRYARFLDEVVRDETAAADAWDKACDAFERSIALSGDSNIEALIAFSQRLITHVKHQDSASMRQFEDVAHALNLLDSAEEILQQQEQPDVILADLVTLRADALRWMSQQSSRDYISELKVSAKPDLGYYCDARLVVNETEGDAGIRRALHILEDAERMGVQLGRVTTLYRIVLMYRDRAERYHFDRLRQLYRKLESDPDYTPSQLHAFRHAVLCYQLEDYQDGAKRFRLLRENARRTGNAPLRLRDWWREPSAPAHHRLTIIRVRQVNSEWSATGFIEELQQTVPLRPRHFNPPPPPNTVVQCAVRFESNGPFAVPPRFDESDQGEHGNRDTRNH